MVIYSELTGERYDTVEECVAAEKALQEQIEREKAARRKEREQLAEEIDRTHKAIVAYWKKYLSLLEKIDIDVDDLDNKAILFVEIVSDAERTEENGYFKS